MERQRHRLFQLHTRGNDSRRGRSYPSEPHRTRDMAFLRHPRACHKKPLDASDCRGIRHGTGTLLHPQPRVVARHHARPL